MLDLDITLDMETILVAITLILVMNQVKAYPIMLTQVIQMAVLIVYMASLQVLTMLLLVIIRENQLLLQYLQQLVHNL